MLLSTVVQKVITHAEKRNVRPQCSDSAPRSWWNAHWCRGDSGVARVPPVGGRCLDGG